MKTRMDSLFNMKTSFLICAYNEENTIEKTVKSVLHQSLRPDEIVVIDDGSTDSTLSVLLKYRDKIKIVSLKPNTGNKARAQMAGLKYITGDIVMYTDADTVLHSNCLERLFPHFLDAEVGGVLGQVVSRRHNRLTAAREIQYIIDNMVYKNGMDVLNTTMIIPGCVGAIRRHLFKVSTDTVTEDMDLTLNAASRGYRIVYEKEAKAYTNDPPNLSSYIRQTSRWDSGFLQNVRKHFRHVPLRLKLQMLLIIFENTFLSFFFLAVIPSLFSNLFLPVFLLLLDLALTGIFALYGTLKLSRSDLILAIPLFLLMRIVNFIIWIKCVLRELVLRKPDLEWHRADRYKINKSRTTISRTPRNLHRPLEV